MFEYFLTDHTGKWAVFDTHHNRLIGAGDVRAAPGAGEGGAVRAPGQKGPPGLQDT